MSSFIDDVIWSMRVLLSSRRSMREGLMSFCSAFFMSFAFASRISFLFLSSVSAMFFRMLFFCCVVSLDISVDAFFALFAMRIISVIVITYLPAFFYCLFYCATEYIFQVSFFEFF